MNPEILKYLPQRPPFVMVDKLLDVTETSTKTSFTISPNNILFEKNAFTEAGLIENIAQTVAAGAGTRQLDEGENPKIGFIGAVKKLNIHYLPSAGAELITTVSIVSSFNNALIVDGVIELEGTVIVSCQMNIFIINEPKTLQS